MDDAERAAGAAAGERAFRAAVAALADPPGAIYVAGVVTVRAG